MDDLAIFRDAADRDHAGEQFHEVSGPAQLIEDTGLLVLDLERDSVREMALGDPSRDRPEDVTMRRVGEMLRFQKSYGLQSLVIR